MGGRRRGAGGGGQRLPTTILFTDIVDSTVRAEELGDERWRDLLRSHHATIRRELKRHGGREIDNAGDGFFAAFSSPADAIRAACAIVDAVRPLGIDVRAGVHVGEAVRVGDKPGGVAVHIGSRITGTAGPGEVFVSGTVRDLTAGSGIEFEDRGTRALKGVGGRWKVYAVLRTGELAPRDLRPERPPAERRGWAARRASASVLFPAAAVLAAIAVIVALVRAEPEPETARDASPAPTRPVYGKGVYVIDPETNEIIQGNETFAPANPLLPIGDTVWVGSEGRIGLYSVSLDAYVARYTVPRTFGRPHSFVLARGSLWVLVREFGPSYSRLYRLDPSGDAEAPEPVLVEGLPGHLVYTMGEFWTATEGRVQRIDPARGTITREIAVPGVIPIDIVADGPILYVLDSVNATIERVDLTSGAHDPLPISDVHAIAVGAGRVWVTTSDGALLGLNPDSLAPEVTNPAVGRRVFEITVGPDSIWMGSRDGRVLRVPLSRPEDDPVVIELGVRVESIALAVTERVVWLGVGCVSSGSGGCTGRSG